MVKQVRTATQEDLEGVKAFLGKANVSTDGIETIMDQFIVMEDEQDRIVATLGVERVEKDGLLRSLVVTQSLGQTHILALFKNALLLAQQKELEHVYLATNKKSSVEFFSLLGFEQVEKHQVPTHMQTSSHISQLLENDESVIMVSGIKLQ